MPAKVASNRSSPGTVAFTASAAYRSWLGRLARSEGCDVSHALEIALRVFAETRGRPAPPPRLNPRLRGRRFGVGAKVRTARAG
jgi:hypothetical protein